MDLINKNVRNSPMILGVDFGETNTGLALGRNGLVAPLAVVSGKNSDSLISQINTVVVENKVEKIVVGIPLTADGKETKESLDIRRVAKLIKVSTKRPVLFQSEYDTSKEALKEAIGNGVSKKKRETNDHLAAALILKHFYDETGI